MSMREKLARTAAKAYGDYEQGFGRVDDLWGSQVDAILRELMTAFNSGNAWDVQTQMRLQEILNESRDTKDDAG